jgi:hypothetical protein
MMAFQAANTHGNCQTYALFCSTEMLLTVSHSDEITEASAADGVARGKPVAVDSAAAPNPKSVMRFDSEAAACCWAMASSAVAAARTRALVRRERRTAAPFVKAAALEVIVW